MRGHRLTNKPPTTHHQIIFTTREEGEFAIISRGGRTGMCLMPKDFDDIQYDCNIHFIKGVEPFEVPIGFMSVGTPMLNTSEVIMHYEMTKSISTK